ncbi:S-receptor-like serine/threonine-protein kinase [Parasponia andersonii]|uniref:Receptor-like serine/threonine-protein kinase n=1 Tax=Parasponia andersonii TaxID=3476 RepID=A0A2P5BW66_PARAD|nr:S-receptor-like serine/threonine-protein kinase [Parasponia andersonii]
MAILTFVLTILPLLFRTGLLQELDSITPFQSLHDGGTLVSKEGSFELGFFTPDSSKNRYLGIWYKNIPVRTVVWVANRCKPITNSSGLLTINDTGNFVLLDQNKSVVWSTRLLKQAKRPKLELLNSGNLVVNEEDDSNSEDYLWQSFDYPSDTLLSGMKFGWDLRTGLNRYLSAWKNWNDPCPSDFTWAIEFDKQNHTYPEAVLRRGTKELSRSGPWNGLSFSGTPDLRPNPVFDFGFVDDNDEVYYSYTLKSKSVISMIVLNSTTNTRDRLTWIESEQKWQTYYSLPRDYCDNFGLCGANGNCVIATSPVCQCLKGFEPKSQEKWDSTDWSQGCVREHALSCQMGKTTDGFLKFSGMKVPDTKHSWVNKSMNINECEEKCLSNCSCMAYTHSDIRGQGSGCAIWFNDLIDIRVFPTAGQDLYIRMPESELGKAESKVRAVPIAVAVIGGVSGMLLLGYRFWRRRGLEDRNDINQTTSQNGDQDEDLELPLFDMCTITMATDNFSFNNKLGEGGFGPVYRGKLEDGQEIAVKRLAMSSKQGINEFKNEVNLIAKLQHRNLVKLLGCCIQGEEKLLVYEYMPNKSLDSFIFDQKQEKVLEWSKRFQIISGIARGLVYLHQDSRLRIIHRDLKTSNVLLDNEMNPKISDFGLARIFGGDQIEERTSRAWTLLKEGRPFELLNKGLISSYNNLDEVLRCIHIGLLCVQQNPADRPNMSFVILMLGSQSDLPQPKQPGYFMDVDYAKGDHSSSKPESCSTNDMSITLLEAR